jgi:hypothetical protein
MNASCLQSVTLAVVAFASMINAQSCTRAQQAQSERKEKSSAITSQEARRIGEAADRFIKRFRETLDFGKVFDEMFVSDAVQRLRSAGFFRGINISDQLVQNLDEAALKRIYAAFMSFYYLKAVYDLGVGKDEDVPPEVAAALRASKFHNLLSNEGSGDSPTITTRQELEEYVADLNNIAALYRRHLTSDVFDSPAYKAGLKAINKQRTTLQTRDGDESLGVGKGTKVYAVEKDIFTFFFIEENGQMKVLTLGIGN